MKKQKRKTEQENKNLLNFFLKILLIFYIFLRPIIDGVSYQNFNYFWNISFFILTIIYIIKEKFKISLYKEELFLLFFFIFCVFSSYFSKIHYSGVEYISQILEYWCFLFLFIRIFSDKDNSILWKTIFFSSFLIILYGIHQYFWGLEDTRKFIYSNPELLKTLSPTLLDRLKSNRIFSTFVYPNIFANFLTMLFPISFFSALSKNLKDAILEFLFLILVLYTLFLTGSTGGIFTFVFIIQGIFLFLILKQKKNWFYYFAFLMILEIFFIVIAYKANVLPHSQTLKDRIMYWSTSFQIFKRNFLLGVGPENYQHLYLKFKHPYSMEAKHAHSLLFETLAENGILGTFFLFGAFIIAILKIFKISALQITYGIGFSLIAGLIHNLIDFDFIDPAVSTFLFLFIGWIIINLKNENQKLEIHIIKLTKLLSYLIIFLIFFTCFLYVRYICAKKLMGKSLFAKSENFYPLSENFYLKGENLFNKYKENGQKFYLIQAEKEYQKAIQLNPFVPKYYRKLAFLYEIKGDIKSAEKMYLKLIETYPVKKQYNIETALFYKKIGDREKFLYFYERSKSLTGSSIEEAEIISIYEKWLKLQK